MQLALQHFPKEEGREPSEEQPERPTTADAVSFVGFYTHLHVGHLCHHDSHLYSFAGFRFAGFRFADYPDEVDNSVEVPETGGDSGIGIGAGILRQSNRKGR